MYKVVLLAGTKQAADAFRHLRLWEIYGFSLELVTDQLALAEKTAHDVLLCPVKSSFVDGAELARNAFFGDTAEKVVLYGRKSYEYAFLAINARAWGYVSLPIDTGDFSQLLANLKQMLDHDGKQNSASEEELPALREYFAASLLFGRIKTMEEVQRSYNHLRFDMPFSRAQCVVMHITVVNFQDYLKNVWKYGKQALYTAIHNFIDKTDPSHTAIWVKRELGDLYVAMLGSEDDFFAHIEEHFASIRRELQQMIGLEIVCRIVAQDDLAQLAARSMLSPVLDGDAGWCGEYHEDRICPDADEKTVISNAKGYIETHYNKEICLDDVSAFVELSPAYFSRLFKQETGENFIDYLVKIRMEESKRLLADSDCKTYEISQKVGYKKSKYFSKLFKRYTGVTPTEYRAQRKDAKQKKQLQQQFKNR